MRRSAYASVRISPRLAVVEAGLSQCFLRSQHFRLPQSWHPEYPNSPNILIPYNKYLNWVFERVARSPGRVAPFG
jgi:hypothetical protein